VFTRRSFIHKGLGAVVCATFTSLSVRAVSDPLHLYIEESGVFGGDGPFCIGALLTSKPETHLKQIRELRVLHHFRSRLLYRSTDKFKLPFARGILNYFFRTPDLRFTARVVSKRASDHDTSRSAQESRYFVHYRKLISASVPKGHSALLTLVNHSLGGRDELLRKYLHEEVPTLTGIHVARLRDSDLLQLANLFAGSVSERGTLENKVKLYPIKQLKRSLGVDTLQEPQLRQRSKFRVQVVAQ
jgi:hypothetical protein